jgi:hypothetical protein
MIRPSELGLLNSTSQEQDPEAQPERAGDVEQPASGEAARRHCCKDRISNQSA